MLIKNAQQENEITEWISYFVDTLKRSTQDAESQIEFTLKKAKFFDRLNARLNVRQLTVVQRMLAEGAAGFKGGMNAQKYVAIAKTSKATATRDLQDLLEMEAFVKTGDAGGRSTRYEINI